MSTAEETKGNEMTKQPEALRLADRLDPLTRKDLDNLTCLIASVELRRLHEANAELLAAITKTVEANLHLADGDDCTLIDLVWVLEKNGVTV